MRYKIHLSIFIIIVSFFHVTGQVQRGKDDFPCYQLKFLSDKDRRTNSSYEYKNDTYSGKKLDQLPKILPSYLSGEMWSFFSTINLSEPGPDDESTNLYIDCQGFFSSYETFLVNSGDSPINGKRILYNLYFNDNFGRIDFLEQTYDDGQLRDSDTKRLQFCKLAPETSAPGSVLIKEPLTPTPNYNPTGGKETFIAGNNGLADVRLEWYNLGYCSYMDQVRVEVYHRNAGLHSVVDYANLNNLGGEDPWDIAGRLPQVVRWKTITLPEGEYYFEVYLRDTQNPGVVHHKTITPINVRNNCFFDKPVFGNVTPANKVKEVLSGYNNINHSLGGYKIEAGIPYQFSFTGIDNFDEKYFFKANYGDLAKTPVNQSDYTLVDNHNGHYTITVHNPFSSITLDPQSKQTCNDIHQVNFFTGGENSTFTKKCLINIACDLPELFPQLKSTVSQNQILRNFVYEVISNEGVIFDAESCGGNGATLEAGAVLEARVLPQTADEELPDKEFNFTKTTVYNEAGEVVGASKSYFDNAGYTTQSQVKNIAEGYVLASQSIYDLKGRASLTTLPAPVRAKNLNISTAKTCKGELQDASYLYFSQKKDFVQTAQKKIYSSSDFDGSLLGNPNPLGTETAYTLGHYYWHPEVYGEEKDKTKYPFVQTEFREDGTGEIKYQVWPSEVYRSATGHQHVATSDIRKFSTIATENDFTPADVAELEKWLKADEYLTENALSLSDLNNQVYQQLVTDANGIQAQSFLDQAGKTLVSKHLTTGDASYMIYDDLGRLIHEISPLAVSRFVKEDRATLIGYSTYEYNLNGQVLESSFVGEGTNKAVYTNDGRIRFTQNSEQALLERNSFTYINYDHLNRVVETGEYNTSADPADISFDEVETILYNTSTDDGLTLIRKTDVVRTTYDMPESVLDFNQRFTRGRVSTTEKVGVSKTWYNYDERGRVVSTLQQYIDLNKYFLTEYEYNKYGSVAAVHFQKDIPSESVSHYYTYDANGRLLVSEVALVEAGQVKRNQLATYDYNLDGSLKSSQLNHANEQMDYRYTAEGWLKGVNKIEEVVDGSNKSFAYQLAYYPEDYTEYNNGLSTALASADGDFTGNIGAMQWKSRMPDIITESDAPVYRFTYDSKYQLTGAVWGALENNTFVPSTTQAYHVSGLNYDPNGNIQFLERKDIDGATKHHLQYNYEGIDNRLTSVTNYGTYNYDVIGRLETATKVGESPINYGYNSDGLLATITAPSTQISFGYDEAYRIKKQNYQTGEVTWYVRDINGNLLAIYSDATTQKEVPLYGSNRVGMYQRQGRVYRYELKDHLGNVRVVINKTGTNTPLVETTKDYYPFGSLLRQAGIGYRYGYQGDFAEDETDEFGLNSFMLRYYDPVLGRWLTPDPAGQYWSTYLAMGNNPINIIDPTGGIDGKWYTDSDNGYHYVPEGGTAEGSWSPSSAPTADCNIQCTPLDYGEEWSLDNGPSMLNPFDPRHYTWEAFEQAIPVWGSVDRGAKALENGDYLGFGTNYAFAFIEAFSFGLASEYTQSANVVRSATTTESTMTTLAKTPVGKRGNPLTIITKNFPKIINGRKFTGHALDQMQARGILSPSAVIDVINNPATTYAGNTPGTMVFIRDNLKVIVNTLGDVVSVIPQ